MFITRTALDADLCALGLRKGDAVLVHAGMRAVGPLLNGPDALIGALRDAVGSDGTVLAYAGWDTRHDDLLDAEGRVLPEWREHVPGFDPLRSRATPLNGIFPEFLRTIPGARRSGNPGAAIVALGERAEWITADHPQDYGYGDGSPLARLVEIGGRVLMIGCPHDTATLLHLAEHRAAIPGKRVLRYEVPFADDSGGVRWRMIEEFDTSDPVVDSLPEDVFQRIVDTFVDEGRACVGQVGRASATLMDAAPLLAFGIAWLEAACGVDVTDPAA